MFNFRKGTKRSEVGAAHAMQAHERQAKVVQDLIYKSLSKAMPEDSRQRTAAEAASIITERGANGYPVGYDKDGNKVEWIPADKRYEVDEPYWGMEMLRSRDAIGEAAGEFHDKVWWNRHQDVLEEIESGEVQNLPPEILATAKANAARMQYR